MRILFLSRWFPFPANNGSKLRILNLLRGLSAAHEVVLLSFTDQPDENIPPQLRSLCSEIRTVKWKEFQPGSFRALLGVFAKTPRSLIDTYSSDMEREIKQLLETSQYDLVICTQWTMTAYQHCFENVPVLYEEIEIGLLYGSLTQTESFLKRFRSRLTWTKQSHYLTKLLSSQQSCTVVSEQEKQLLSGIVQDNTAIHVIPNCVRVAEYADIREARIENSIIFTGSFNYRPNYEAVVWFLEYVYPLIQAQISNVCLSITGDHANLPIPQRKNVHLTGYVDDVRPYLARACASIVPLQQGGGTRLKILEAMALKTPVVSTSKGAEGLDVENGIHLLTADIPEDFASQVVKVLKGSEIRDHLTDNGYRLVQRKYDWDVVLPEFVRLAEKIAFSKVERKVTSQ